MLCIRGIHGIDMKTFKLDQSANSGGTHGIGEIAARLPLNW